MASSRLVLFALIAIAVPTFTLAMDYMVGDESGWTVGVDYQSWVSGKTFVVGDRLIFKYPAGNHNVYKATGGEFQKCTVPKQGAPLISGSDVVVLATAGKKWYICGFGGHCEGGQKLVITVLPDVSVAPFAAPTPSPWN